MSEENVSEPMEVQTEMEIQETEETEEVVETENVDEPSLENIEADTTADAKKAVDEVVEPAKPLKKPLTAFFHFLQVRETLFNFGSVLFFLAPPVTCTYPYMNTKGKQANLQSGKSSAKK